MAEASLGGCRWTQPWPLPAPFPYCPSHSRDFSNPKLSQEKKTAQSNKQVRFFLFSACVTMSYTTEDGWKWNKLWNYPSRWAHSCRRARLDTSSWQPWKSVRLLPLHTGFPGLPPQPACAQHSPAEPPGPSTHKTSHARDTGPAPHMQGLDQDLLPQECWSRQSLSHGGWKREGDPGESEEPEEAAWVKQVTTQQPPAPSHTI